MKQLSMLATLAMASFLTSSCTQEEQLEPIIENTDVVQQTVIIPADEQTPNSEYDSSRKGIYHGIISATSSLSRGKVWINLANDDQYNAIVRLTNGQIINYEINSLPENSNETRIFEMIDENDNHLIIDVSDYLSPKISEMQIESESYYSTVVKSGSQSQASAITATFEDPSNPSFSGTWNLVSDGLSSNPNGMEGESITALTIVMNGTAYTETEFEAFYATNCLGISEFVPIMNFDDNANNIICSNQTTQFADGMAKWDLGFDAGDQEYFEYVNCTSRTSGTFTWVDLIGDDVRIGNIIID